MPKAEPDDHKVFLAYAPLGILPVICGGLWIFYIYAFASMVDPALVGWERNKLILQKMFPGLVPGAALILAGLTYSILCVIYAISGSKTLRPTGTVATVLAILVVAVVVVTLVLG